MDAENKAEEPTMPQRPTPRRQREPTTFAELMVLMDRLPAFTAKRWQEMEELDMSFNDYGTFDKDDDELVQTIDWLTSVERASQKHAETDPEYAGFLHWKRILYNINNNHTMVPSEMQLFTNFQKLETYPELKELVERWLGEG